MLRSIDQQIVVDVSKDCIVFAFGAKKSQGLGQLWPWTGRQYDKPRRCNPSPVDTTQYSLQCKNISDSREIHRKLWSAKRISMVTRVSGRHLFASHKLQQCWCRFLSSRTWRFINGYRVSDFTTLFHHFQRWIRLISWTSESDCTASCSAIKKPSDETNPH
jgi:hypothetical protein